MENIALQQLVDEVRDLPLTVSDVLAQVITECDNADASVSSLASCDGVRRSTVTGSMIWWRLPSTKRLASTCPRR